MLRAPAGILQRLALNESKTGQSGFALEFVRWRRKPRWLPTAKSKLFRVPERKQQTPEEKAELLRLHNNYKTQLRSVRQYLREENQRLDETSTAGHFVLTAEQEEAEFQRCLQENEKWNQEIALMREQRLAKEKQEKAEYIKERLRLAKEREEERMEQIEALVKKEKELSKTFITRENLETAIEQALANPVDYNFSIDLHGNMYQGRTNTPGNTSGGGQNLQTLSEAEDRLEVQN
ncbi:probable 28S ribosomal protein S26, mitochondrial [Lucilia sericata]|uniref:probable 28S ribosomal protein S26, mitochondrial n=1 Tax=Lucilia sericata TaxID=13632 RepID=UPI0018A83F45|nr:probable 28S ribosomal protein S26, mitochondrial [Lucilia sericata]